MMSNGMKAIVWGALLLAGVTTLALAAPFSKKIPFTQPDGTAIMLFGEGDEFYAVFETLDGYTVVFDQPTKSYEYAQLSADGSALVSSGLVVGHGDPKTLGVVKHLRISPAAIKKQVRERFQKWDQAIQVTARWNQIKAAWQQAVRNKKEGSVMAPLSYTTTGTKVGLTLLIDFSDDTATIPQANIIDYCNGDSYTGYGNNGSVKKYFSDNSNGQLTYSNVVTIYIRAPQPKTYYNDTAVSDGTEGRKLITDAINTMKALPNYTTEILPTFTGLTVDGNSCVVACNVFFAGAGSGVWAYGLWAHSWSLASALDLGNGKNVYKYQISDIGTSLKLGTFCHENGHMLCGFPDIYDYDYDSRGGAGYFSLMDNGGSSVNPCQVDAYLKRAAGWATITELTSVSSLTASLTASAGPEFNHFYRFVKPGVPTEYFIVENRQKTGRDASLPASGIAIWHVDELGDHNNQSMVPNTTHANYELTLEQADNLWHFENNANYGDANDLYYSGNPAASYNNQFNDSSAPHAHWWDGTLSRANFRNFSASAATMTFSVMPAAMIVTPTDGAAFSGQPGGPFTQSYNDVYTLTNTTSSPLTWSVTHAQAWADVAPTSGTLAAHAVAEVTITINSQANILVVGSYIDVVSFADSVDSGPETRSVTLRVRDHDYFTELFDTTANDLAGQTFTFRPNGSASFYTLGREPASSFPTDPSGGTVLNLFDDDYAQVILTGGALVSLYGTRYGSLYVGSNGYITFGSGDMSWAESFDAHFNRPRISALFDDLYPPDGGTISWKQLADRFVVTFEDVPEVSTFNANSFQMELFFNGVIRITYLNIAAVDGLAGLSQGLGIPADFVESDLSTYGPPAPLLYLNLPASATEGSGVLTNAGMVLIPGIQPSNVVVALLSSDLTEAQVTNTVTILAGQTNAFFNITIVDDLDLDGTQSATITAAATGYWGASNTMAVYDNESGFLSVVMPTVVTEGMGVLTNAGRVNVSAVVATNVVVSLTSSDPTEVTVPANVTVLVGQTSAVFNVTVVDDTEIDGTQMATVTAQVVNWTPGNAVITVLDNEGTNLTLTLPALGYEGQVLTYGGRVAISGTLPSNLVVNLVSDDTNVVVVPNAVTVLVSQTTAYFNMLFPLDGLPDGTKTGTVTSSVVGFVSASGSVEVRDRDLHHLELSTITSPQAAGTPFSVTLSAQDINGATIMVYQGSVALTCAGDHGPVTMQPTNAVLSDGVWNGSVRVNTPDTNVRLTVNDGLGHSATSTPFNVVVGPFDHFSWGQIGPTQFINTPFPVMISAKDAANNTVSPFTNRVGLSGWVGRAETSVSIGSGTNTWDYPLHTFYHDSRTQVIYMTNELGTACSITSLALNVTTVPGQTMNYWTIRMKYTPLAGYGGSPVWDTGWTTVYQTNEPIGTTGWRTFVFTTPFNYNGTSNLLVDFSHNNSSWTSSGSCQCTTGSQTRAIYCYTDSGYGDPLGWPTNGYNPTPYVSSSVPNVRLGVGGGTTVAISPTNTTDFIAGVWSNNVTVLQQATNMYLRADDGAGHSGPSGVFNVGNMPFLRVTLPASATEGDGVLTSAGMVSLPSLQASNVVVALISSDLTEVQVTNTVTVLAGQTNVFFDLTIVNDAEWDGTQWATITASAAGYSSVSNTMSVYDNEPWILTVIVPTVVTEGMGVLTNAGRVYVNAAVATNVTVALTSSDTTEIIVTNAVTILPGQTSAVFNVTVVDDTLIDGPQTALVTAHVPNWTDGGASITVLDNEIAIMTFQGFETYPGMAGFGSTNYADGWALSNSKMMKWTSDISRNITYQGSNSVWMNYASFSPWIQTPLLSNGVGSVTFYASSSSALNPTESCAFETSSDGTTWVTNSTLTTNIFHVPTWVSYTQAINLSSPIYLRLHLTSNSVANAQTYIDNLVLSYPQATIAFTNAMPSPNPPSVNVPFNMTVTVTPDGLVSNLTITNFWSNDGGSSWHPIGMVTSGVNTWITTNAIPGQPAVTIQYYFTANFQGPDAVSPFTSATNEFTVQIMAFQGFETYPGMSGFGSTNYADGWALTNSKMMKWSSDINRNITYQGSNSVWMNTASTGPCIQTPLLSNGVGSITFFASSSSALNPTETFAFETSSNGIIWVTNSTLTAQIFHVPIWTLCTQTINLTSPIYLRLHLTSNSVATAQTYVDNLVLSYPRATVAFTTALPSPNPPNVNVPFNMTVTVTPDGLVSNTTVTNFWSNDGGSSWHPIGMVTNGVNTWITTNAVPGQSAVTIQYYFTANFQGPDAVPFTSATNEFTFQAPTYSGYKQDSFRVQGDLNTNLWLVGDYNWLGVAQSSAAVTNALVKFRAETTNQPPTTNIWGDIAQARTLFRIDGAADTNGTDILIGGTNSGAFIFTFVETNLAYSIDHGVYQSFDAWTPGSTSNADWTSATGLTVSDANHTYRSQSAQLPTNGWVMTPLLGNGIGQISFWYRDNPSNGLPATACSVQTSVDGETWTTTLTNLAVNNPAYQRFALTVEDRNSRYVRLRNGTNEQLCLDDVIVTDPFWAGVTFGAVTNTPAAPTFFDSVYISGVLTPLGGATGISARVYYRDNTNAAFDYAEMTTIGGNYYVTATALYATAPSNSIQYYLVASYGGFQSTLTSPVQYPAAGQPLLNYRVGDRTYNGDRVQGFEPYPGMAGFGSTNYADGWALTNSRLMQWTSDSNRNITYQGSNSVWMNTASTGPWIQTPLVSNGVGNITFFAASSSALNPVESFAFETSSNGITWVTNSTLTTNIFHVPTWLCYTQAINVTSPIYLRLHLTSNSVANAQTYVDNLVIGYLPALVSVTNVIVEPGYPSTNDQVFVACDVASISQPFAAFGISPKFWYRIGGATNGPIPMNSIGGVRYRSVTAIPAQPVNTLVEYSIQVDFSGYYGPGEQQSPFFYPGGPKTQGWTNYIVRSGGSSYSVVDVPAILSVWLNTNVWFVCTGTNGFAPTLWYATNLAQHPIRWSNLLTYSSTYATATNGTYTVNFPLMTDSPSYFYKIVTTNAGP